MARILGTRAKLDSQQVKAFFEKRGKKIDPDHPLTSILYQDHNPSLAEERDHYEKTKVIPLLDLCSTDRVLDLGCGIGRWCDAILNHVNFYYGIDFSESLIKEAKSRYESSKCRFQRLAIDELSPEKIEPEPIFSKVIIAGVLIYLNDQQVESAMQGLLGCCAKNALVYIREPIAEQERLTLKEFWSDDLSSDYNAIYRTREELFFFFNKSILRDGFILQDEMDLYPDHLNNRQETKQRIFVFKKK